MDVWLNQIELIESRINNHLRHIDKPLPLRARVALTEALDPYVPPVDPQAALRSFYMYVNEARLDWKDHRGYVWPPWIRDGELAKFESSDFFKTRERQYSLRRRAREAMIASDAVLLASGTATLEAMLCKRPMVVGYRIAPLTYRIVKGLGMLKVERYALPNVLAGEDIAPELMQDDCTPDKLSSVVLRWFREPEAVAGLQPVYQRLHAQLRQDASASAAAAVAELIAPPVGAT